MASRSFAWAKKGNTSAAVRHHWVVVNVAELICHSCGTVSYSRLPVHRTDTMPLCKCGGRRQVVRVRAERRRESQPVIDDRRVRPRPDE